MGRKAANKMPEFVEGLVDSGTKVLTDTKLVDDAQARALMQQVAEAVCWRYSKTFLYVPVYLGPSLARRDELIFASYGQDGPDGAGKYTTDRVAQLARDHNLTTIQIYCIVRSQKNMRASAGLAGASQATCEATA